MEEQLKHIIKNTSEDDMCKAILKSNNLVDIMEKILIILEMGFKFNFGSSKIPIGTKLYRIRKYDSNTDFSQEKEWGPPPHKNRNRANIKGQSALYLSSEEFLCVFETALEKEEEYMLGEYECLEDIEVSGFFGNPNDDEYKFFLGVLLNAILIAPSKNEKNNKIFEILEEKYKNINEIVFEDFKKTDLPFKIGVMFKEIDLYDITNKIFQMLHKNASDGCRYSSCYVPVETIGIESNAYNLVLYENGINKVRKVRHCKKKNEQKADSADVISVLAN